jgi:hypothetical protein
MQVQRRSSNTDPHRALWRYTHKLWIGGEERGVPSWLLKPGRP